VTGKPNVDWCETHPRETVWGNTVGPLVLADACQERGVYLLHIGSGCIYYGASPHPDRAWREDDFGNPAAVYSRTKWAADLALTTLPNVGVARIRMPIDSRPGPSNYITKVAHYPKLMDVENSVTILDDLPAALRAIMEKRGVGVFHVTNPGTLKLRELIALYDEMADPTHVNEWIREGDLVSLGLAARPRSNNALSSGRLAALGIEMREVHEALRDTMEKYAKALKESDL
jgi:dTDP-4-dehydrorhamnose reductase